MTENWTIVGPTLEHSFDPETGNPYEYGALCAFLVVDGVEHGACLTCSAEVAKNPDDHYNLIASLKELAKETVRDKL